MLTPFVESRLLPEPAEQLTQAYKLHRDALQKYCQWQLSSTEVAEEVMQETFLRTWEYMQSGKKIENLRTFLYRVANNLIVDERRRRGRGEKVSLDVLQQEGFDIPHNPLEHTQQTVDVDVMMKVLNPGKIDTKLLYMRYADGLRIAEVARRMGMTIHAVAMRHHRLIKKLHSFVRSRQERK